MARKKRVHASPMRPEIQGALWVAGLYGRLYQENATCSNIRWSKTDLEAVMLPVYKAQLYLLGERAKELALQGDGHPNENWPEMVGKIDREIAACQAQKVQYYEAYRNGDLDRGAFV